jgi:very-short-patch-repair endonuclease
MLLQYTDEQLRDLLYRMHHKELMSVLAMSKELEVSRDTLNKWMVHFGVDFRSGSDANKVRFSKMTEDQRKKLTEKANKAARGRTHSIEEKARRAVAVSGKAYMSEHEKTFAHMLIDADVYDFIFSYPLGIYNIDFAFPTQKVAVEVDGGNWHASERKRKQDDKKEAFLTSEGWTIYRWSNLDPSSSRIELIALLKRIVLG